MTLATRVVSEVATWMGLVPLVWLALLHVRGTGRDRGWWWLAIAFAVSWMADTVAHWVSPDAVGNMYPLLQAAIVALVLLGRDAALLIGGLVLVGIVAAAVPVKVDLLLRTVAWGSSSYLAWNRWELGLLRTALLVSFGLALVAWYAYAAWPGWTTWLVYQGVRAVGIALFCRAAVTPVALGVVR